MHSLILALILIYFLLNKPSNNMMPAGEEYINTFIKHIFSFSKWALLRNFILLVPFRWTLYQNLLLFVFNSPSSFCFHFGCLSVFVCSVVLLIWWSIVCWPNWWTTHINWTGVDWFYAIHISLVTTLDLTYFFKRKYWYRCRK